MGHVNSTQGNEERRVSQPTTSFDFETDANIVHNGILNTEKYLPKLDVISKFFDDYNIMLITLLVDVDQVQKLLPFQCYLQHSCSSGVTHSSQG
jgi:hypothetical protein